MEKLLCRHLYIIGSHGHNCVPCLPPSSAEAEAADEEHPFRSQTSPCPHGSFLLFFGMVSPVSFSTELAMFGHGVVERM